MDCIVDSLFSVFVTLGELITMFVGLVWFLWPCSSVLYVLQVIALKVCSVIVERLVIQSFD